MPSSLPAALLIGTLMPHAVQDGETGVLCCDLAATMLYRSAYVVHAQASRNLCAFWPVQPAANINVHFTAAIENVLDGVDRLQSMMKNKRE